MTVWTRNFAISVKLRKLVGSGAARSVRLPGVHVQLSGTCSKSRPVPKVKQGGCHGGRWGWYKGTHPGQATQLCRPHAAARHLRRHVLYRGLIVTCCAHIHMLTPWIVLNSLPVLSVYHDPMSDVNTCLLCQQFLLASVKLSGSFTSAGSMQCAATQPGEDGVVASSVPGRTSSRRLAQFAAAAEDAVQPGLTTVHTPCCVVLVIQQHACARGHGTWLAAPVSCVHQRE